MYSVFRKKIKWYQMRHQTEKFAAILLVIIITLVQQSEASCGTCGTNGIACISATQFHICFNNQPDTNIIYECPDQGTCTALLTKCSNSANVQADCSTTNMNCGCQEGSGKVFACTSRTTFAQCDGANVLKMGNCTTGLYCKATGGDICVDECSLNGQIQCDLDVPEI